MRRSGILMHISSLPGPDGIGSLGPEAYAFADFLHKAGMSIWQVLPMGPTGYGESPYQATSIYAGNPLLISLDQLAADGFLTLRAEDRFVPENEEQVDYGQVRAHKMKLLRESFRASRDGLEEEIRQFVSAHPWVRDFAMFTALKEHFDNRMWSQWPDAGARHRTYAAMEHYRTALRDEIDFHTWCQYIFHGQWHRLKDYCNRLGILLFGDMPIYVAEDSADTWSRPEVFQLDGEGVPRRIAGVPPDYFSEDGQLWGNPLYRWSLLKRRGFDWWVDRMAHMGQMYDMVRVDHFIGFANYYSVAHGAPNAKNGVWIPGPGEDLFRTLKRELPDLDIVAEDLGAVNDRVRRLLAYTGYPGMKVLTFAFGGEEDNMHLPQNIPENTAYYTGTHDNATARAWAETASDKEIAYAAKLLGFKTRKAAPWALIRTVYMSRARIAVVPMQDVLELPAWATMNHPGLMGGNWLWRMKPGAATGELAEKLAALNRQSRRNLP